MQSRATSQDCTESARGSQEQASLRVKIANGRQHRQGPLEPSSLQVQVLLRPRGALALRTQELTLNPESYFPVLVTFFKKKQFELVALFTQFELLVSVICNLKSPKLLSRTSGLFIPSRRQLRTSAQVLHFFYIYIYIIFTYFINIYLYILYITILWYVYICICIHTYIHMHKFIYMYIHIHIYQWLIPTQS